MHKSVLLQTAIDELKLEEGDVYLDATLGGGGHAEEVFRRMKEKVVIAGIDADETAIEIAKARLELAGGHPKCAVLNFKNIDKAPDILKLENPPTKILFDLGWSAMQMEESGKGFSFLRDEPLIMTFGKSEEGEVTAYTAVNFWKEETLADVIYGYGEEKHARRIARAIVQAREKKLIESSLALAEIVKSAVPVRYRFGKIRPATRTFQSLRIAVNDELQSLQSGLEKGFDILQTAGRMAVISFHSLEDRIVKKFCREKEQQGLVEIIHKKPITPSEEEIAENPRSRSAKLRIIKKI